MTTPLKPAKHSDAASAFCDSLLKVFSKEKLILFAGAGVSVHAGLLDWRSFVAHLITIAEKYERETAAIMSSRTKAGLLADAVSYYKLCRLIPEGVKFKELITPFSEDKSDPKQLYQL